MNIIGLKRYCPICGNGQGIFINEVNMMLPKSVTLPQHYEIVACTKCGFTFANSQAAQEDYNQYYQDCNIYGGLVDIDVETGASDRANEGEYKLIQHYFPKEIKILDMGCGRGRLLRFLKGKGYSSLFGIDPSQKAIDHLLALGIKGKVGNLFDETPKDLKNVFDGVFCTSVVEHIFDLDNFVKSLQSYLKPEGFLFIDAPAVEGINRFYQRREVHFNHEHINYFSLISLDNLMKKGNFIRINNDEESYYRAGPDGEVLAIQAVYRYVPKQTEVIKKDNISYAAIRDYLEIEDKKGKQKNKALKLFIQENQKVVVWGTGSYTMQLLTQISGLEEKIAFFVDNNEVKNGMVLAGKKIYLPNVLYKETDYPIIICSMHNAQDIISQMDEMGLNNRYFVC